MKKLIFYLIIISILFFSFDNINAEKPIIIISSYFTSPREIPPGSSFDLEINLKNQSEVEAKEIIVTLESPTEGLVSVVEGSNQRVVPKLIKGEEQKIRYRLYSEGSATTRNLNLVFNIDFIDKDNQKHSQVQIIGLLFTEKKEEPQKITKKPLLLIKDYTLEPKEIIPGDEFILNFTLKNESEFLAKNILINIGLGDGKELPSIKETKEISPFKHPLEGIAFLNSSNIRLVKELGIGKERKISFRIFTSPKISSHIYNFEIGLSFENEEGVSFSSSQIVSIPIFRKSNLKILSLEFPEITKINEEFGLIINLVNASDFPLKLISATLEGEDFEITQEAPMITSLDSAMEESLEIKAKILNKGDKFAKLIIKFKGDKGEEKIEREIKIKGENSLVSETEKKENEKKPLSFWQKIFNFFKALLGLGTKN